MKRGLSAPAAIFGVGIMVVAVFAAFFIFVLPSYLASIQGGNINIVGGNEDGGTRKKRRRGPSGILLGDHGEYHTLEETH